MSLRDPHIATGKGGTRKEISRDIENTGLVACEVEDLDFLDLRYIDSRLLIMNTGPC